MRRIHKIIQLRRRQLHFYLPPSGLDPELPAPAPNPVVTLQVARVRGVALPTTGETGDQALACRNTNIATTSTVSTAVTMKLKK
ncbi:hypothetical protein PspTeo4_15792 [Pseudomonas sp. Teo4]|nr:hypothetical protein [Pseudomonas sp. Teo4]